MKKVMLAVSACACLFAFTACGGPASEAKAALQKGCECEKMSKEENVDSEKLQKCMEEFYETVKTVNDKYKDDTAAMAELEKVAMEFKCEE